MTRLSNTNMILGAGGGGGGDQDHRTEIFHCFLLSLSHV